MYSMSVWRQNEERNPQTTPLRREESVCPAVIVIWGSDSVFQSRTCTQMPHTLAKLLGSVDEVYRQMGG